MKSTVLFLFLVLVSAVAAQADTELKFEKAVYYGDSGNQVGKAVKFAPGHLYVAGSDTSSNAQALILNYAVPPSESPLSNFRWPDEQKSAISVSTTFSDLAVSSEGLYGAGSSLATMSGKKKTTQLLGVLAKFPLDKSNGKPLWVVYSAYSEEFKEEVFRAVATATEPNSTAIYVTGHAVMGDSNLTAVLAKYDATGKLLWSKLIGDTGKLNKSGGTALVIFGDYIYVAGFSNSEDKSGSFNSLTLNPTLWKYDSSGNQIWMKTSPAKLHGFSASNQDNLTHGIKADLVISDNYIYLTSGKAGTNKDPGDFLFSKYDLEGKSIWETAWAAKLSDDVKMKNAWALGIAAGRDRIYVGGYGEYKDKDKKTYGRNNDSFLIEVDKDYGSVLAVHAHGVSGYSEITSGMTIAGTDVYLTGFKNIPADPSKKNSSDNLDVALLQHSVLPVASVNIDIEPSTSQNNIVLKDEASEKDSSEEEEENDKPEVEKVTVAIFSTKEFKAATQVKLDSLTFGRTGNEASWDSCNVKDVNKDGIADLLCYFKVSWNVWEGSDPEAPTLIFKNGDKEGVLKGMTLSGARFMGKDVVRVGESDSPAPQPAPEPEPPAPTPTPEPAPPLVSEPPAPTPTSTPEPVVQPAPNPPLTSETPVSTTPIPEPVPSEPSTPPLAPESTLPLGSDTSTVPEPTPTSAEIVQQPSVPDSSVLPATQATTETSSTSTSSQTESLTPIVHATIVTQPTTTQTTKLQPIAFVSQPVATNQPATTSTTSTSSKTVQSSTSLGSSGSSTSNLQAILSSRSGETRHANGIFSSGTDSSEEETSDSETPALAKPLKTEGDGSKSGSGLGKAYGDMGKKAFQEGNFSEAIANYTEALKLDPDSPELHTDFGLVLVHEGRLEEARDHFSEALKLNPDDQTARENLDLIMTKLGKSTTTEPTPVVTAPSVTVSK